jgi:hypothetical protein
MGMSIDTPFIAHSELTDEIYVIDKKAKYCVTDQVMKAVVDTNRAIPKADYENRLKADLKAILVELQLKIEEKFNDRPFSYNHHQRTEFYRDIDEIIQQKINSLKEAKDENEH